MELGKWMAAHGAWRSILKSAKGYTTLEELWMGMTMRCWMEWVLSTIVPDDDPRYRPFACWCVRNTPIDDGRTVWDLLGPRYRHVVEVAERYTKGEATQEELTTAWLAANPETQGLLGYQQERAAVVCASFEKSDSLVAFHSIPWTINSWDEHERSELGVQESKKFVLDKLREIFADDIAVKSKEIEAA